MAHKSKPEILWIVARVVLGAVFLAAAAPKIIENAEFATVISNYRLLPLAYADKAVPVLAAWLPWFEGVLGLALICGVLAEAAASWTAILMVIFMAAGGLALARGLDVSCGCFGAGSGATLKDVLPRDLVLLALSFYVAFFSPARKKWAEMNKAAAEAKARQAATAKPASPAGAGGRPGSAGVNVSATRAAMEAALRETRERAEAKAREEAKAPEAKPAEAIPMPEAAPAQAPAAPAQAECVCPPEGQPQAQASKAASEPEAAADKATTAQPKPKSPGEAQ